MTDSSLPRQRIAMRPLPDNALLNDMFGRSMEPISEVTGYFGGDAAEKTSPASADATENIPPDEAEPHESQAVTTKSARAEQDSIADDLSKFKKESTARVEAPAPTDGNSSIPGNQKKHSPCGESTVVNKLNQSVGSASRVSAPPGVGASEAGTELGSAKSNHGVQGDPQSLPTRGPGFDAKSRSISLKNGGSPSALASASSRIHDGLRTSVRIGTGRTLGSHGSGAKERVQHAHSVFTKEDESLLGPIIHKGVRRGIFDLVLRNFQLKFEHNCEISKDPTASDVNVKHPALTNLCHVVPKTDHYVKMMKEVQAFLAQNVEGSSVKSETSPPWAHQVSTSAGQLMDVTTSFCDVVTVLAILRFVVAFNKCEKLCRHVKPGAADPEMSEETRGVLDTEFSSLLSWRLHAKRSGTWASASIFSNLLQRNPMYRFLHELRGTSVVSEGPNYRIDRAKLENEIRKFLGLPAVRTRNDKGSAATLPTKRKHSALQAQDSKIRRPRPADSVLQALLKGLLPLMRKAVKDVLANIRNQIRTLVFKEIGARLFMCAMYPGDPGFQVRVPSRSEESTNDDDGFVFPGRNLVPQTLTFESRDCIGNFRDFPESFEDLHSLLPPNAIQKNRDAFFKLMDNFPEFKVVTTTRQLHFRPRKGDRAWDTRDYEQLARKAEKWTATWASRRNKNVLDLVEGMPEHWHPVTEVRLHELAMSILTLQTGMPGIYSHACDVFMAGNENSLLAVHSLAVTMYGAFRKQIGKPLARAEKIHCGTVNLFYDTDGTDAALGNVGLVGVQTKPHELFRSIGTSGSTQFERAGKTLSASFRRMLTSEMFVHERQYERFVHAGELCAEMNPEWPENIQPQGKRTGLAEPLRFPEDEDDEEGGNASQGEAGPQSDDDSELNDDCLYLHDI